MAKADIEAMWTRFQNESDKWVELAKDQQATFQARAQAQVRAWQDVVDTYMRRLAEVHEQNKAQAEAHIRSSNLRPTLRRPKRTSKPRSMILPRPVRRHGLP